MQLLNKYRLSIHILTLFLSQINIIWIMLNYIVSALGQRNIYQLL